MLTVITPAATFDLTTLDTVKVELGLTDGSKDAQLTTLIHQASGIVAAHCKRVFAAETVAETLRPDRLQEELILARYPVSSIASIIENGITLVTTDYQLDGASGILTRLHNDRPAGWPTCKIEVSYVAGYALLDGLPWGVERATVQLVKAYYHASTRDPALRSEDVPDIASASFLDIEHLPHDIRGLLAPFRNLRVG